MKIHLATDHAGFHHKQAIAAWLRAEGYKVVDHGAASLDSEDDFPDFISKAAEAVSKHHKKDRGIILGGSGQGEAMLANRYPQVRAVVFYGGDTSIPKLSRQHNDSNVLSIGARFADINVTKQVIWEWLHTDPLPDTKYARRNKKIEVITKDIHS
ncbi:MAG: RpiB/LacA/LacB family sugar-phosphate isomerase [Candidatus Kaiserbacteria bacterium]|nr:RpiB/LacA/LacB family sugar-phosphate isomerase [Candidatus Kaiserbacteria bacterium]MCB9816264.1 RpiB/LacA/LacB family sugar-phosphate isomerase [Candidatus Nomurabacteria bacterium]